MGLRLFAWQVPFIYKWPVVREDPRFGEEKTEPVPSDRYKRCNLLLGGFVPGPNNHKEIDSVLFPLIEELLRLECGISRVWNAEQHKDVKLKAHICATCVHMPC